MNVLAALPSYVPSEDNPLPAVNAFAEDATTPVKALPSPLKYDAVTVNSSALLPDTIIFFQFAIVMFVYLL